jgi:transposase-like protein
VDGTVALADPRLAREAVGVTPRRHPVPVVQASAFRGFRFPPDAVLLAVRWYLRFGLFYRDLEELLAERGIRVDHVSLFRWVQRFTPLVIEAGRPCRHAAGSRWFVDETYLKVAGSWRYLYRAVDQHGQVIDVHVSARRDVAAARRFFTAALASNPEPAEVVTDLAPALAHVVADLVPEVFHSTKCHANNRVECDHGRLEGRLRPMRGLNTDRTESSCGVTRLSRACVVTTTSWAPTRLLLSSRRQQPSTSWLEPCDSRYRREHRSCHRLTNATGPSDPRVDSG